EEAAIRLDVGNRDEHGVGGDGRAVDLDLKAGEPRAEQKPAADAPVPEVAQHAILRLAASALGHLLHVLEQTVRAMRQKQVVAGRADVDATALAMLQQLEHGLRAAAIAEDAREHVAEARGHGDELGITADRCRRRRALRGVAAHAYEVAELRRARGRPEAETVEIVEGLYLGLPPAPAQQATETERNLSRGARPGAGGNDDLHRPVTDPGRHAFSVPAIVGDFAEWLTPCGS